MKNFMFMCLGGALVWIITTISITAELGRISDHKTCNKSVSNMQTLDLHKNCNHGSY